MLLEAEFMLVLEIVVSCYGTVQYLVLSEGQIGGKWWHVNVAYGYVAAPVRTLPTQCFTTVIWVNILE